MGPIIILAAGFGALLLLGVPIAYAMLLAGIAVLLLVPGITMAVVASQMLNGINSWPLLAIPLFILAGHLMTAGGVTKRLVDAVEPLTSRIPGSLAHTAIVSNMIMAGMTGSDVADVTATGTVLIPGLEQAGYSAPFAATLVAAAGGMGPLVPPSIAFILYGFVTNVSIPRLFAAGLVPGIALGLALMIMVIIVTLRSPRAHAAPVPASRLLKLWLAALPGLSVPIIIIGGIVTGVFTPTEGSGVAVLCALILGLLVYREIRVRNLLDIAFEAAKSSAAVLLLLAGASVLTVIVSTYQLGPLIARALTSVAPNATVLLLVLSAGYLVVGTLLELTPVIVLIVPLVLPTAYHLGIDPVQLGVMTVLALLISLRLPPLGLIMFVVCRIGHITPTQYRRTVWPALLAMLTVLLIVIFFPSVALGLPNLLHTR